MILKDSQGLLKTPKDSEGLSRTPKDFSRLLRLKKNKNDYNNDRAQPAGPSAELDLREALVVILLRGPAAKSTEESSGVLKSP